MILAGKSVRGYDYVIIVIVVVICECCEMFLKFETIFFNECLYVNPT